MNSNQPIIKRSLKLVMKSMGIKHWWNQD